MITDARSRVSTLPPLSTSPTRRSRNRSACSITAASGTAPAPSATTRATSRYVLIAASIEASLTVITSVTSRG